VIAVTGSSSDTVGNPRPVSIGKDIGAKRGGLTFGSY
jgi:hypothetical protein